MKLDRSALLRRAPVAGASIANLTLSEIQAELAEPEPPEKWPFPVLQRRGVLLEQEILLTKGPEVLLQTVTENLEWHLLDAPTRSPRDDSEREVDQYFRSEIRRLTMVKAELTRQLGGAPKVGAADGASTQAIRDAITMPLAQPLTERQLDHVTFSEAKAHYRVAETSQRNADGLFNFSRPASAAAKVEAPTQPVAPPAPRQPPPRALAAPQRPANATGLDQLSDEDLIAELARRRARRSNDGDAPAPVAAAKAQVPRAKPVLLPPPATVGPSTVKPVPQGPKQASIWVNGAALDVDPKYGSPDPAVDLGQLRAAGGNSLRALVAVKALPDGPMKIAAEAAITENPGLPPTVERVLGKYALLVGSTRGHGPPPAELGAEHRADFDRLSRELNALPRVTLSPEDAPRWAAAWVAGALRPAEGKYAVPNPAVDVPALRALAAKGFDAVIDPKLLPDGPLSFAAEAAKSDGPELPLTANRILAKYASLVASSKSLSPPPTESSPAHLQAVERLRSVGLQTG